MDARRITTALWAISLALAGSSAALPQPMYRPSAPAPVYRAESPSFSVAAPDPRLAAEVARLAEQYRRDLAIQWLGHELPQWRERCPITVEMAPHAGGETTFAFVSGAARSEPSGWQMRVYGPPERILDAVLPHEVTHTIFATHFGRPLPRWADEGACTTVEHSSERNKIQGLLVDYLSSRPSRGLPFNRMFTMMQYPQNPDGMLPLYAQSYSVARFLILQGGHRHFIRFVEAGLAGEATRPALQAWNEATRTHYGYEDLSELQVAWIGWVGKGSPDQPDTARMSLAGSYTSRPLDGENAAAAGPATPGHSNAQPLVALDSTRQATGDPASPTDPAVAARISQLPAESWYRNVLQR